MNIIIGFVLLVYGVAGVIGAFLVYRWLFAKKGPFEQLRVLIKKAADKIQEASGYAVYASKTTGEASSALQVVSDQIGKTLPPLNASVEAVKFVRLCGNH